VTDSASFVASLRTGEFHHRTLDWLGVVAFAGLILDVATTWHTLTSNAYVELNPVVSGLGSVHPAVGVAAMAGVNTALVVVSTHRLGWLSSALAGYLIVTLGVFGGLNNLALFVLGGPSLLGLLGEWFGLSGATVFWLTDTVGIGVGLVIARLRHGRLPWGEVTIITTIVVLLVSASFQFDTVGFGRF